MHLITMFSACQSCLMFAVVHFNSILAEAENCSSKGTCERTGTNRRTGRTKNEKKWKRGKGERSDFPSQRGQRRSGEKERERPQRRNKKDKEEGRGDG